MADLEIPNQFVNGMVADAVQVNANFDAVKAKINGNIDAGSIKDDSVTIAKLGTDVNTGFLEAGAFINDSDSSGTISVNLSNSANHVITLTGVDRILQFVGTATPGQVYRLIIKQDATGSRTILTYPTIRWALGVAPVLTTTASKADIITLLYDGTDYFGSATFNF